MGAGRQSKRFRVNSPYQAGETSAPLRSDHQGNFTRSRPTLLPASNTSIETSSTSSTRRHQSRQSSDLLQTEQPFDFRCTKRRLFATSRNRKSSSSAIHVRSTSSFGCQDLFITFTCNALWPEIEEALSSIPGQQASDRPDIVDRVFQMKLKLLMDDIEKSEFFGPTLGVVYTIEFQKRGLPHVHLILWLKKDTPLDAAKIDAFISAQLPDPSIDPMGFEAVSRFMIHGPCGSLWPSSPCMNNSKCDKLYPQKVL